MRLRSSPGDFLCEACCILGGREERRRRFPGLCENGRTVCRSEASTPRRSPKILQEVTGAALQRSRMLAICVGLSSPPRAALLVLRPCEWVPAVDLRSATGSHQPSADGCERKLGRHREDVQDCRRPVRCRCTKVLPRGPSHEGNGEGAEDVGDDREPKLQGPHLHVEQHLHDQHEHQHLSHPVTACNAWQTAAQRGGAAVQRCCTGRGQVHQAHNCH
mmetsp:Transcript_5656/g.16688  ORF Transcript_5656/g.16688 Transcript_5656/m.16688 type:complete len:218 (+) Transcript_5656:471-1124(+)